LVTKTVGGASLHLGLLCVGVLVFCACTARAQDTVSKPEQRRAQYPELMNIYDLAEGSPAPLKALALLRIATSPGLKDVEWKEELLTEAFPAAAQEPSLWKTSYVFPAAGRLSVMPHRMEMSDDENGGLLRLTLEAEIVEAMLAVDRREAVSIFNQIAPLRLPVLTCSDGLIPDAGAYYQAATAVAKSGFTADQKKNGDPAEFLRGLIVAISSPVEIRPAANMLVAQHFSADDAPPVISDFARRLETLSGDDRAFFADLDGTSKAVMNLADSLNDSLATEVLKAWRNHLILNLTGDRCKETLDSKWHYSKVAIDAVTVLNSRVVGRESVAPIEKDDIHPGNVASGSADDSPVVLSAAESELHRRWFAIEFGKQNEGLSNEQKADPEWIANFDRYLDDITDLKPSTGESDADVLQRKCGLMHQAVMIAPPGPLTDRVIAQYVQLLQLNNISLELVSSWYSDVAAFLSSADILNHARSTALKAMEASNNPPLIVVAKLEKLKDAAANTAHK
jgi:hypothetical protein